MWGAVTPGCGHAIAIFSSIKRYNLCYTQRVKTAISLPEDLFRLAEAAARKLKMSRSQLYATALEEYLERRKTSNITAASMKSIPAKARNCTRLCIPRRCGPLRGKTGSSVSRGEIWWADLPEPRGSEPGYRRPVLVIQANSFNRSRIQTVIVAVISSNLRLAEAPGNVLLPAKVSGLPHDSVVNVSQLLTLDRSFLTEAVDKLPGRLLAEVDMGLKLALEL